MIKEEKKDMAVNISQKVAVLVDGNNIEKSVHQLAGNKSTMVNFDTLVPKLLLNRSLTKFMYFREGASISPKLAKRLHRQFFGVVKPCYKSADVPLTIEAVQLSEKVDTIIIMSGDFDYIDLVKHLKARGLRVEIASMQISTSKDLMEECDYYHEITEEDFFNYDESKTK